ncbi:MAG TPA: Stealth CR1 domain-containing protein [Paludibacter sp.]|jgi:hypothetical protein|nr:MAG: Capsular polysaccharide phosphotransferase cps12A [Bacteroidetes bacterium ADurb.Bin174]HQB27605.1 Stealth CR1 domain-containing protein [Paludibacter sp.]
MSQHTIKQIDLVYLWVDGSDPLWRAKQQAALASRNDGTAINTTGRYVNNDELKYSLRSVEKHLPWIRKIFIITDNQTPSWLDIHHPKITIVDHREILPPEALPCFNSRVIEYFMYRIPDLSEYFLYANDDMFVNTNLLPSFFFGTDGLPIVRLQYLPFQRIESKFKNLMNISINSYRKSIDNSIALIKKKFGVYYPGVLHHNIDAYRKSDFAMVVEKVFKEEFQAIITHQFRTHKDIQRIIFSYYALAVGRAHLKFATRKTSSRIRVHRGEFQEYLDRFQSDLFCLNDSERANDEDRALIRPFLENLFPDKSQFEKGGVSYCSTV